MKHLLISSLAIKAARLLIGIMLLAIFVNLSPPRAAFAASITVTTTADDFSSNGNCTLREAIYAANMDMRRDSCVGGWGADTISVPAGTYTLNAPANRDERLTGDLDITTGTLTIVGASLGQTIIRGYNSERVFDVHPGAMATISHVMIEDGMKPYTEFGSGGTIRNQGTLNFANSYMGDNAGSGIMNEGTLYVSQSTFSFNMGDKGGAIWNGNGGSATVDSSTLESNYGNLGGAIYVENGSLTVVNSTISGNTAMTSGSGGGGIYVNLGNVQVQFSTITRNKTYNVGSTGGGITNYGTTSIWHTIIAGNTSNGTPNDCSNKLTSEGFNLIQSPTCTLSNQGSDLLRVDPMLGPLDYTSRPTWTHAPLPGSPVIDAGSLALTKTITKDQRGADRPIDGNGDGVGLYDIGAVEFNPLQRTP